MLVFLLDTKIYSLLLRLIVNLLDFIHLLTRFNSFWAITCNSLIFLLDIVKLVSSANKQVLKDVILAKSLMYIMNKNGPKVDP